MSTPPQSHANNRHHHQQHHHHNHRDHHHYYSTTLDPLLSLFHLSLLSLSPAYPNSRNRGYALVGNDEAGGGAGDGLIDGASGGGDGGHHREHFDRGRGRCGWLIGRCGVFSFFFRLHRSFNFVALVAAAAAAVVVVLMELVVLLLL